MTGKNWGKVPSVGQRNNEMKRGHRAWEGEVGTWEVKVAHIFQSINWASLRHTWDG